MMSIPLLVLATCAATLEPTLALDWLNEYDKPMEFSCGANQYVNYIHSVHDNYYEDRKWQMGCKELAGLDGRYCSWTEPTAFDEPFDVQCGYTALITGMKAIHNDYYEDRRFQWKCCPVLPHMTKIHSCYLTDYVNEMDGPLTLSVADGMVIKGVKSFHKNYEEDRKFQFTLCKAEKAKARQKK